MIPRTFCHRIWINYQIRSSQDVDVLFAVDKDHPGDACNCSTTDIYVMNIWPNRRGQSFLTWNGPEIEIKIILSKCQCLICKIRSPMNGPNNWSQIYCLEKKTEIPKLSGSPGLTLLIVFLTHLTETLDQNCGPIRSTPDIHDLRLASFTVGVIKTHKNSFDWEKVKVECSTGTSIKIEW